MVTADSAIVRAATRDDLAAIRRIYNEGVEDRAATLEADPKTPDAIEEWWSQHDARYAVLVAVADKNVVGWASLNRFSHRCAHAEIADLSVYVERARRGGGVGFALLSQLVETAALNGFHKIVLHAIDTNESGKRLYRKCGFDEVGVFRDHGRVDGRYVDVVAMELLLVGRAGFEPA